MSRRGLADLVPMPLPTQYGTTVIPAGSTVVPNSSAIAQLQSSLPAGHSIGWQQVRGGWRLAVRTPSGGVLPVQGAAVVPYPGAQAQPSDTLPGGSYDGTLPGSPGYGRSGSGNGQGGNPHGGGGWDGRGGPGGAHGSGSDGRGGWNGRGVNPGGGGYPNSGSNGLAPGAGSGQTPGQWMFPANGTWGPDGGTFGSRGPEGGGSYDPWGRGQNPNSGSWGANGYEGPGSGSGPGSTGPTGSGLGPNGSGPDGSATDTTPGSAGWNPASTGLTVLAPPTGRRILPPGSNSPGMPWGREPILPDSMLPLPLQRSNPLIGGGEVLPPPNGYDNALKQSAGIWNYIRRHGGLKSCCRLPELGAPIYDHDPRLVMPSQAEPFQMMFALPTGQVSQPIPPLAPGPFTGVDTVLGQFVVPNGYDGVINRVVCNFTGDGFLDFQGLILWRVLVNNRYARNLGAIQNTYGDFKTSFMVPGQDIFRLVSQQTVTLIANIPIGSPVSGGVVAAGAFGWFYPRR
jgi:hypothetical protein